MVRAEITRKNGYDSWDTCIENLTIRQLNEYRKLVYDQAKVDWSKIYEKFNHAVFYTEYYGKDGTPDYAKIYLDGSFFACDDQILKEVFQKSGQFVIALHR